jgi:hypothetical protein
MGAQEHADGVNVQVGRPAVHNLGFVAEDWRRQ